MKILQLNSSDWTASGGTGVAMYGLHAGLRRRGIDSKILSGFRQLSSPHSLLLPQPRWVRWTERLAGNVTWRLGLNEVNRVLSGGQIRRHPAFAEADLVNFHCIFASFFSYLSLPALTRNKPAVFTVHDQWAYTGHCAYSYECTRFETGCGSCPHLEVFPPARRDATALEWKLKHWAYRRSHLDIVATSLWQKAQIERSMLNRFPIHHIPYGVDPAVYRPLDRAACRAALGIDPAKKVLLFGAHTATDRRKGGDLMVQALAGLPAGLKKETVLVCFGTASRALARSLELPVISLGHVASDLLKAAIYSAADVFLFPTRAEVFGIVSLESQACGVPVVSFAVGGVPEHIEHGQNGLLARPENTEDFRDAIISLLTDEPRRLAMGRRGRERVEQEFSIELNVERYLRLYQGLLAASQRN